MNRVFMTALTFVCIKTQWLWYQSYNKTILIHGTVYTVSTFSCLYKNKKWSILPGFWQVPTSLYVASNQPASTKSVCVCVFPPDRTYKDQDVFTHLRCEDHRSCEDRYLVLINLKAPNDLNRGETCWRAFFMVVLVNHLKCV